MLDQAVALLDDPAAAVARGFGERPVLLDGRGPTSWGDGAVVLSANPVATLEIGPEATRPLEELERFSAACLGDGCAGIAVALSYDLKHWVEHLPRRHSWPRQPLLYAAAYDWAYRADRNTNRARLLARDRAAAASAEQLLAAAASGCRPARVSIAPPAAVRREMSQAAYVAMVRRAKQYIAAGDIYQANLAHAFRAALDRDDASALFAEWTRLYPTPYAAYLDGGDWALASNSPECFLDVDGSAISTMPIKGTRPRRAGDDAAAVAAELAADAKDRAEHVMIVDLERSDLGRVCVPGTVRVEEMQSIHHFPVLVHMMSTVRGSLRAGVGLAEILRATFPGGSITGAPKVRAMEIIEELEPTPRGFYTGSIGWIERGGRARFNIAIRTALIDGDGLTFHAGGGIVADSNPMAEYAETLAKSESLLRVLTTSESRPREGESRSGQRAAERARRNI